MLASIFKQIHVVQIGKNFITQQARGRKLWRTMPDLSHIKLPPLEERQLIPMSPVPEWHGLEPKKTSRRYADMRGPELVNNDLIYGQFGIMAVSGVHLTIEHINLIRNSINQNLDLKRMFAVWRIEPPWKPISKKSQGKKMGGGKSSIHHYVTPVRAASVIVEVGGHIEFDDCNWFLSSIVDRLPCDAFVISKEILEQWKKEEEEIEEKNINPINYERVVKLNMLGCNKWISPYDKRWFGKYT